MSRGGGLVHPQSEVRIGAIQQKSFSFSLEGMSKPSSKIQNMVYVVEGYMIRVSIRKKDNL